MARLSSLLTAVFFFMAVGFFTGAPMMTQTAEAQYTSSAELERENSDVNKMFHKLGRGLVNVFTGWLEIPKQTAIEWRRTDPFTGTVLGVVKGLWLGIARTVTGVYEVVTFPFPIPRNYEPIMEPEFVLPTIWGERLPLFRDEFIGSESGSIDSVIDYSYSPASGSSTRSY